MWTWLMVLGTSFLFGVVLTPVARALAARYGLVDLPDGRRKMHAQPIPLSGGLAVFAAACIALAVSTLVSQWLGEQLAEQRGCLAGLFFASCVICCVGLVDDCRMLRGRHKVLGQLLAVAIVIGSGVFVERIHVFGFDIELGWWSFPFTAFFLLGAVNSLNLIDGMDGLLSCVGAIISLAVGIMAALAGQALTAALAFALTGALLAFLCYNFPPASIFLGDCGSMLVGLIVGVLAINSSLKSSVTVTLAAPAAMLAIPIFDTLAAIVRRKLTGRSIYTTDRGHIHHCMLRNGLSTRKALLVISCCCMATVVSALVSLALNNEVYAIFVIVVVANILIFSRLFGHAEFRLLKEHVIGLFLSFFSFGRHRQAHEMEVRLQGSADWQELWRSLIACADSLDLKTVRLDVNAPAIYEGYHARWDRYDPENEVHSAWRAEIPLVVRGQTVGRLEVTGRRDSEALARQVIKIAKLAEDVESAVLRLAFAANGRTGGGLVLPVLEARAPAVLES